MLVAGQMLWFGTDLRHSLLNPNQLRAFGLDVHGNPFDRDLFGVSTEPAFIPFDTTPVEGFVDVLFIDWTATTLVGVFDT